MSEGPRFTDQQLALILKRAANLQAAGDESRHSLEEIRQIAAQVGIPPELVTRAASEVVEGRRPPGGLLGPETSFFASSSIPMRVASSAFPELLSVMRRRVGSPGNTSEISGSLEWRGDTRYSSLLVTVTPGEGETVVAVQGEYDRERNGIYAALLAAPIALGLVAAAGAMESGRFLLALAIFAGVGLLGFGAARFFWTYLARAGRREVRELRDALVEQLTRGG